MKRGTADEQSRYRGLDLRFGAIDMMAQQPAQASDALTAGDLCKSRLRIDARHERLGAHLVSDHVGSDPDCDVGTIMDGDASQARDDEHQREPWQRSSNHGSLPPRCFRI